MENTLDLYALPPDPTHPLVNLDEFSKQLLSEVAHRRLLARQPKTGAVRFVVTIQSMCVKAVLARL